ncbi:(4Fe-4S)-binding protein [Lacinutrix iliipiscaria]|uniref:(4Fe-4S)-binding protein n=1 Tax=Lacinutrix iliipiscaria TaxID=1230532 RepID=A0ABW5WN54_9FLAO
MEIQTNVFSNEDITVTFNPKICINAERCAKELSEVFRTTVIPWINLDGVNDNRKIINQIKKCPSGALQYCHNKKEAC